GVLVIVPELFSTCAPLTGSRPFYNRAPRCQAGNESRVAPGQMLRGCLGARLLVELFGQLPILGRVLTDCLQERIPFTDPPRWLRALRGRQVAELGGTQGGEIIRAAREVDIAKIASHGYALVGRTIPVDRIRRIEHVFQTLQSRMHTGIAHRVSRTV